jgi:solute:Na+ symporter, SSS family
LPHSARLAAIDYAVMLIYFAFVLAVGYALKRYTKTSTDFFLSGRRIPVWITALAFISANLGAQEVIGMGASGAKYGIATCHFYWMAVPAMVFLGILMMPFYYGSRARSVPEYLKLRFDEKTRALNAISFAIMTIFSSGVSMYAMGKLFKLLLGWNFDFSMFMAAGVVLCYTFVGGLSGAIYNEVLQFFLIVFGFAPLALLGLLNLGGWSGLKQKLAVVSVENGFAPTAYTQAWAFMGHSSRNPIGVEWFGLSMGLGFVLAFGYWCTDFLVVQRAMAANSMSAARRTPLIAAVPKMFFPILVVLPGMIALVASPTSPSRFSQTHTVQDQQALPGAVRGIIPVKVDAATGKPLLNSRGVAVLDYDLATPMMVLHYFPSGMLGLGMTALLASFMSGMAGNVTAFNTVWTYDVYQSYIYRGGSDLHYLWMGRAATVGGVVLSVVAAYAAASFNNIMDVLQLVFAFVNAPLFATFALGMFWRRATGHGAFVGLVSGTASAAIHHGLSLSKGSMVGIKGGFLGDFITYPSELAQTFWTAIVAFTTCLVVTTAISLVTRPRPAAELRGLVYSLTPRAGIREPEWYRRPEVLAVIVLVMVIALQSVFF